MDPLAADGSVRFGVIGLGGMGTFHLDYLEEVEGVVVTAVCDADPARAEKAEARLRQGRQKLQAKGLGGPAGGWHEVRRFGRYQDLLEAGGVDAILIATPHYQHPEIAVAAFERDVHVLSEKPLAVSVGDARRAIDAHARKPRLKFGLMLQMRTVPLYKKLRALIADGELGEVTRVTWLVTDWFRTWAYYASGGWRATWAGEGGGVLINQCPHNLDMLWWLTGLMPQRITAVAHIGKTHPIEVEDEVSAIMEYPNGATGHFVTTTGEAPGTNRLEICGDRGKVVAEGGKLAFSRTVKGVREIRETSKEAFVTPEAWQIDVPVATTGAEAPHRLVVQNFVRAVLKDEPLVAPGADGAKGLEIGNAMLMAGLTRKPVDLPLDGGVYDQFLKDLAKQYGGRKTLQTRAVESDMTSSFAKP